MMKFMKQILINIYEFTFILQIVGILKCNNFNLFKINKTNLGERYLLLKVKMSELKFLRIKILFYITIPNKNGFTFIMIKKFIDK